MWNFQKLPSYTFYGGNVLCVPVPFCFSLSLIFTLVATSISHFLTTTIKFSCFSSNKIVLCFFLFLALPLSLFSTLIKRKTWLCCCFFLSYGWFVLSLNFFVHMHVNFMRVNKVETMYGRSHINVKVEPHSIFMFTRCLSYIVSISFTHLNFSKNYTAVEIPLKSGWPCELPLKHAGCLKCNISPQLTWRGEGTYRQTSDVCMYYIQMILSKPKFLGCIDKQIFLSIVFRCSRFTW